MATSYAVLEKLAQIERELNTAVSEYPSPVALDRLKATRALVRFVRAQLEDDDEATIPILTEETPKSASRS